MDVGAGEPQQENGAGDDDQEEDPGEGGGVPHVEPAEGVLIEVIDVEEGRVGRSALGEDVGVGEGLKRRNDGDDGVEEDGGGDQIVFMNHQINEFSIIWRVTLVNLRLDDIRIVGSVNFQSHRLPVDFW